ncbi:Histidine kinase-, DNA gyrase B-, and HSP90-like ATPase [Nonomuraea solani]|uniref:histidine kinase n=1 Tax=Nonomuraea solani TaxID=1144553 RepID=A0A1H5TN50_9ACTN|nr:histidine kinase [Nonomuraea solani]SEF63648.1 Histidine kinase-, DNA gyrase B-, and HSP90-like ATPase [Nonomuraea solani]
MDDTHPFFARRLSRHQQVMLDLVAGMCFAFVFFTTAVNAIDLPPWARIALALGLGLPLAVRRLWPVSVFYFTLLLAAFAVMTDAVGFAYVAPAFALYVVALSEKIGPVVPTSAIGFVSLVTVLSLAMVGVPGEGAPDWVMHLDKPLMGIAALGGAWTVGRAVQERRVFAARNAERLAAHAVTEERLRIARELHDVVTHSVGLIAVKAGVANHVMASKPEEAYDALRVIETASRSALVEMRHLLGVLRSTTVPDLVPAPGVAGIQGLVEQARLAGVEAELDIRMGTGDGVRPAKNETGWPSDDGGRRGGAARSDGVGQWGLGRSGSGSHDPGRLGGGPHDPGRSGRGGPSGNAGRSLSGGPSRNAERAGRGGLSGNAGRSVGGGLPGDAEGLGGGRPSRYGEGWVRGGLSGDAEGLGGGRPFRDAEKSGRGVPSGDVGRVAGGCGPSGDGSSDGVRLPDGVALSVYRIVQEALTNVVKHAAPARCRVSVVADGKEIQIEVIDDGPGRRVLPSGGAGHGLIGMRERVMMYGGALEAGSLPGRGFRVFARLPYQEVS